MTDVDRRIDFLEKFFLEKFRNSEEAVKVALESNAKRLDSMNEFRETLADQSRLLITRNEAMAIIGPMRDKIEANGRPNIAVLGSFASLIIGGVAGLWMILGLRIDNANSPLVLQISQIKTQVAAHLNVNSGQFLELTEQIKNLRLALNQGKTDRIEQTNQLRIDIVRLQAKVDYLKK